jgi:hypothetical protein
MAVGGYIAVMEYPRADATLPALVLLDARFLKLHKTNCHA